MKLPDDKYLILFDGYCHLCSHTVQTILKFDKKKEFIFVPLNSDLGITWRDKLLIPDQIDSVILIHKNKFLIKSEAFIRISHQLGGIFHLVKIVKVFPLKTRDRIYDYIARNRFKWYGKRNSCFLPAEKKENDFR